MIRRLLLIEEVNMKTGVTALCAAIGIACMPLTADAVPFVSSNPGEVAAFQADATIITFEGIPGVTAFNNQTTGAIVPPTALLKSQIPGLTFFSNFAGGPTVVDLTGFANITDAKSPPNILGGTDVSGDDGVLCFTCFIEVLFASPVNKVGAWNDPTGGRIQLLATATDELGNTTTFGDPFADQGQFVGVSIPTNSIQRALFQFIPAPGVFGFSLDDLTYARASADGNVIPEPASLLLFATGAAIILARPLARKIIARRS
jgi:hypothetical protein